MSRIGVFGGSFDPVHFGHLIPAAAACESFALDHVVFVPAGRPPHKQGVPLTPFAHRFAMLALATRDDDRFLLSDIEADGSEPSFTIATLGRLRAARPGDELFFLMGSDSFAQLPSWHRWREITSLAGLIVLHRAADSETELQVPPGLAPEVGRVHAGQVRSDVAGGVFMLEHEPVPISATELRARLRRGEAGTGMAPADVLTYARKHRLYDQGEGSRHGA